MDAYSLIDCCQSHPKKKNTICSNWLFLFDYFFIFTVFHWLHNYFDNFCLFHRWILHFFYLIRKKTNSHSLFPVHEIWYDREFIVCVFCLFLSYVVFLVVGEIFPFLWTSASSMQYVCNTNYYYRQIKIRMTYQHITLCVFRACCAFGALFIWHTYMQSHLLIHALSSFSLLLAHTRAHSRTNLLVDRFWCIHHIGACVCVWVRAQLSKCLVYFFIHTCDGNLSSYLNQSEMWNVRVQCHRDNNSSNRIKANMKWIHRACIQRRIFPLQRGTFNSFYTVFRWNSIWKLELTKYDMMREQFYRISHFIEGFPIKSLSNLNLFF